MNPLFTDLMSEAVHLTRSGRLTDATAAIQRALRGGVEPPSARSSDGAATAVADADVIDVQARVVGVESPASSPTASSSPSATVDQWTRATFTHQGRTIDYRLFVPARADSPSKAARPLVLMLHGCTQSAADFAAGTRMNDHARECGAIVLYPEQAQKANGQKCWNWFKSQHQQRGRGEPALLAALTRQVAEDQHADSSRIYAAGLSAGGAMADVLGHCYPELYAAIGVHSGLPYGAAQDMVSALTAMRTGGKARDSGTTSASRPTIVLHGDADTTVHANNGLAIVAGAARGQVSEGQSPAGQRFTRTVYPGTAGRGDAEHWRLHGAGHAWSGGSAQGSYTHPAGIDASREMLRFFLAHPMDAGPLRSGE